MFPTATSRDVARLLRLTLQSSQDANDSEVLNGNMLFPTPEGQVYQSGFEGAVRAAELYARLVWSPVDRVHYPITPGEADLQYIAGGKRSGNDAERSS
jgi:hypothetical protein